MKKMFLTLIAVILTAPALLAQAAPASGADEGGGISFRMIMNIVFGVMALALLALGIWYFKLKRDNE